MMKKLLSLMVVVAMSTSVCSDDSTGAKQDSFFKNSLNKATELIQKYPKTAVISAVAGKIALMDYLYKKKILSLNSDTQNWAVFLFASIPESYVARIGSVGSLKQAGLCGLVSPVIIKFLDPEWEFDARFIPKFSALSLSARIAVDVVHARYQFIQIRNKLWSK